MEPEKNVLLQVQMPERLKRAIEAEAEKRMTSVSALVREQLIIFLPANMGNPMEAANADRA